ncbi:putative non-specific serine/threonine protein kinase [Helianthus debilis subsp. tardiflorus]
MLQFVFGFNQTTTSQTQKNWVVQGFCRCGVEVYGGGRGGVGVGGGVVRWYDVEVWGSIVVGIHIEDDRKALLEIKASLREASNFFDVDNLLPTWVDQGSTGGKYCEWERIKCDATSGHVTDLSLSNIFSLEDYHFERYRLRGMIWPLNVSLFLHFKELRKLDLSWSYIGNTFISTGSISTLRKLRILNLGGNQLNESIVKSLSALPSLKALDLGGNLFSGSFPLEGMGHKY